MSTDYNGTVYIPSALADAWRAGNWDNDPDGYRCLLNPRIGDGSFSCHPDVAAVMATITGIKGDFDFVQRLTADEQKLVAACTRLIYRLEYTLHFGSERCRAEARGTLERIALEATENAIQ